jgi:hypothetical protein
VEYPDFMAKNRETIENPDKAASAGGRTSICGCPQSGLKLFAWGKQPSLHKTILMQSIGSDMFYDHMAEACLSELQEQGVR